MSCKFLRYSVDFFLIALSSLLLVLSFPDFDLGFLAWIGLLPLLFAINGKSLKYGFFLSFVCGMLFFSGNFYWIFVVPNYSLLHHTPLIIYFSLYLGVFGLLYSYLCKGLGITPALFAAPFIWVSLEHVRSNLSFLALPWALLAHSQYLYPSVIQVASLAGTYSISFLIVMVNVTFASLVLSLSDTFQLRRKGFSKIPPNLPLRKGGETVEPLPKEGVITPPLEKGDGGGFVRHFPFLKGNREKLRGEKYLLVITVSLLFFTLIYGYITISQQLTGNRIKLSLVQGNIEQKKKWDPKYAREIMQIYAELTEEAAKSQPALIIWPETATPGAINRDIRLHIEVRSIAKNAGTYLLLGSGQQQKFGEKGSMELKYLNSAFLINPEPKLTKQQRYYKIRLFPFGEYLPYKEIIPWSLINVRESGNYAPGEEFTIFEHPNFRFGVIICWENVFPELVRQFVKGGAQCVINLTNEAHFGRTAASHQLVGISVFRAVENRVFVIRCANTGVSCIIDPHGRIIDRVKDEKGQDIFVRGVMSGWVVPLDSKTIYTQYGDLFVWVVIIGSGIFLAVPALKARKK